MVGEREFIDIGSHGHSTQIDVLMDFDNVSCVRVP